MKQVQYTLAFIFLQCLSLPLYSQTEIQDSDLDTKVETERNPDQDIIWFKAGGIDRARFTGTRLEFLNTGSSLFIGDNAGANDDLGNNQNVFIGESAGTGNVDGEYNVAMGRQALMSNVSGRFNMAFGGSSMVNTTGSYNVGIGGSTLLTNTTGQFNIAIGFNALRSSVNADRNTAIGSQALRNATGNDNLAIGFRAGFNLPAGIQNVLLGNRAGYNSVGSGNILIGFRAGYSTTESDRLYIENSSSNTPLIYGEFDNDIVKVNGQLVANQGFTDSDGDTKIQLEEGGDEDIIRFDLDTTEYFVFTKNADNHARLEINDAFNNTFVGKNAGLNAGPFAVGNTALGNGALFTNSAGYNNTAIGQNALLSNTSGFGNLAIGFNALGANNLGVQNVAVGIQALNFNTIGNSNVAIGSNAMFNNTTGTFNVALGHNVLATNIVGKRNCVVGESAMFHNRVGSWNCIIGAGAMYNCDSVDYTIAIGDSSLFMNGIGATGEQAKGNSAIGSKAMYNNTTGASNTSLGFHTLFSNNDGNSNTAIGYKALNDNTSGAANAASGFEALKSNTTGSSNSGFGFSANSLQTNYTNSTGIGFNGDCTASNQVRVGDAFVTSIGGYANWTNVSDQRFKQNIQENVKGLEFINTLRPVTYTLNRTAVENFYQENYGNEKTNNWPIETTVSSKTQTGFIAQEVEAAANELNFDFSGVDAPKNDKDFYGLRYAEFTVPLVKAVQELSASLEELKEENAELKTQLAEKDIQEADLSTILAEIQAIKADNALLKSKVESLESSVSFCCEKHKAHLHIQDADRAYLDQNTPNPFTSETQIKYYVPAHSTNAMLHVLSTDGRTLQAFKIVDSGLGSLTINTSDLQSGTYRYALSIDGKIVDTKSMLIVKN